MKVITAIRPDPRRPGRVRLEVNGQPFCTLEAAQAEAHGMRPGREVDGGLEPLLDAAADTDAALRALLRALERRSYARRDLERRLRQRGHAPAAIAGALTRADELGLLDDAAYAQHFVATRAARGRGPARLIRDLLRSGVARPIVDAAIAAQWPDGSDPDQSVAGLVRRRAELLRSLPRPVRKRRILAFLARRGYSGHSVRQAVDRLIG
ncbi:MAG TPA: regulatory protein RecX [Gemmatimonadales bacterium]|nr:regulatory protein RecX [Gemmatimonadales bacterium]